MELKELLVQQYKHLRRREGNWWLFHEVMKDESETAGEYVEVKLELCLCSEEVTYQAPETPSAPDYLSV